MQEKIKKFLKSISYTDLTISSKLTLDKVILKKDSETFEVFLSSDKPIDVQIADDILQCSKNGINNEKKCIVNFNYHNIDDDNLKDAFKYVLNKLIFKKPSLSNLMDNEVDVENNNIILKCATKSEESIIIELNKKIVKRLKDLGYSNVNIIPTVDEELNQAIKEEINNIKIITDVPKKEEKSVLLGKHIDGELSLINDLVGDQNNIIVEAYVFGIEAKNFDKTNILTMKISDLSNSILAKFFIKDLDEFNSISKNIKEDNWYRIHGNVKYDEFVKDFVLMVRNMEKIDSKSNIEIDNADVKRVELHTHTMMSAMDGVIDAKKLVKTAAKMGMKAIAVTDHNCVQAFPDLYHAVCDLNAGKEGNDRFKVL